MNRNTIFQIIRYSSILVLLSMATRSWSQLPPNWDARFLPPTPASYRTPEAPLRIQIGNLTDATLKTLVLELDDIDMSSIISIEDTMMVITPPQPLEWGKHQLRLVEFAEDGSILEHGFWEFEVRQTALFREAELQIDARLSASSRVSDSGFPEDDQTKNENGEGTLSLQGSAANGIWRSTGNADFIYNSDKTQLSREGHIDMGQFLFTGTSGMVSAKAGHHSPINNSLIAQDFNRRGISATLHSAGQRYAMKTFALRTDNIIGFRDGLGVGESEHRTQGVTVTAHPIDAHAESLAIYATYLSSKGSELGFAESGDSTESAGKASSVIIDSNLLDRRLRLRGEVARSEYDFGGLDSGFDAEKDKARSMLITYAPEESIIQDQPMMIQVGMENKRIGTFFKSEANAGATADRDLLRGFGSINWGGLYMQLSTGRETDNVNDIANLGRTKTDLSSLSMTYSPLDMGDPETGEIQTHWYGQATFDFATTRAKQNVTELGEGLALGPLNENSDNSLIASFYYDSWDWSLSYMLSDEKDFLGSGFETETRTTAVTFGLRPNDEITISATLDQGTTDDLSTNLTSETQTLNLNLSYVFSETLSLDLNYDLNQNRTPADTLIDPDDKGTRINATNIGVNMNWIVQEAEGVNPGIQISLDATFNDVEDEIDSSLSEDTSQVFLRITGTLQPNF